MMNKILDIDGMTGSGKSTCLQVLLKHKFNFASIPIYSDREKRPSDSEFNEANPIIIVSKDKFQSAFVNNTKIGYYSDEEYGNRYAVKYSDIKQFSFSDNIVILCTNLIIVKC